MKYLAISSLLSVSMLVVVNTAQAIEQTITRTVVVERQVTAQSPARRVVSRVAALSSLPTRHATVVHAGRTYYVADGRYYLKQLRGYVAVTPVAGIRVKTLPNGVVTVRRNGQLIHRYNNINYRRINGFYVVV